MDSCPSASNNHIWASSRFCYDATSGLVRSWQGHEGRWQCRPEPFLPFHRCSASTSLNCSHCAVGGCLGWSEVGALSIEWRTQTFCSIRLTTSSLERWWCSKSVHDGRQQVMALNTCLWKMPQNIVHRPGQGGTRGASSGLKYGPIAALFKAVTRGILPAYLTMAGETKIFSHLSFKSQVLTFITFYLYYSFVYSWPSGWCGLAQVTSDAHDGSLIEATEYFKSKVIWQVDVTWSWYSVVLCV